MQLAGVDRIFSMWPLPGLRRAGKRGILRLRSRGRLAARAGGGIGRVLHGRQAGAASHLPLGRAPGLAIITGPDAPAPRFRPGPPPTAEVTDPSPNAVSVALPRGGGGYLLLSDTYAPGWHAYGDGRTLPLRLAYLAFRAVPLPQAVRRVEFRYEPASYRLGLFLSLFALSFLAAASGALRRRERRAMFSRLSPRQQRLATALLLLAVVGLAACLRLTGLDWGLPNRQHYYSYHPDEIFLLLPSVLHFGHGDWNPGFFNYGSLYLYLVGVPAVGLGYAQINDFASFYHQNLPALYYLGRLITALLGIGSVALLYFALRPEGRRLAMLSALLFALMALHAVNSHYATVDVPATFWLVLAFAFALRGARSPKPLPGLLAGLAVGLAAATKYNAGLFLLPVIVAPLLGSPRTWRFSWLGTTVAGAAAGFVLGCPYFWTPDFLRGLLFETQHMRQGGTFAFVQAGNGWTYHLLHGLPVAVGFPFLLALALGIYAAYRRSTPALRLSLLWIVLYLLVIGFAKEWFIRYLVPITPFLAVIAASGLLWLWQAPRAQAVRIAALGGGSGDHLAHGFLCPGPGGGVHARRSARPVVAAHQYQRRAVPGPRQPRSGASALVFLSAGVSLQCRTPEPVAVRATE